MSANDIPLSSALEVEKAPASRRLSRKARHRMVGDDDPVSLFQGYDSFFSNPLSTAVEGSSGKSGLGVVCKYSVCTSIEQVSQALNISASVAASCGFGSTDAKTTWLSSLDVTTTSVHIVAYANCITEAYQATDVNMISGLSGTDNALDFFAGYGDSYISEIARGAEYMAVYSFQSTSADEQQSVIAQLSANGISAEGELSANLQANFNSACTSVSTSVSIAQNLLGASVALPQADEIIVWASQFVQNVSGQVDAAVTMSFKTTSYLHVPGFPQHLSEQFRKVRDNVRWFKNHSSSNPGPARLFANAVALQASCTAVQSIYNTYHYTDSAFTANAALVDNDVDSLTSLLNDLDDDPTQDYKLPKLNSNHWAAPTLQISLNSTSISGGNQENPFNDVSLSDVYSGTVITSIQIWGDAWMNCLTVTYIRDAREVVCTHGCPGGYGPKTMSITAENIITNISSIWGDYVNQLTISSTELPDFTYPANPQGGTGHNEWSRPSDGSTCLLGFSGSAGDYLDNLNVVSVTFAPAVFG